MSFESPSASHRICTRARGLGAARGLALTLLSSLTAPPLASAQAAPRTLTELPTLGGSTAIVRAINAAGTVLGESQDARIARNARDTRASWRMFMMRLDGPMVQLESFAGLDPLTINAREVVVGTRTSSSGQRYAAFRWSVSEGTVDLPAPPGRTYGTPVDLDDAGNILMFTTGQSFLYRSASDEFVPLSCLPAHTCRAVAMNEAGAIVGIAEQAAEDELGDPGTGARKRPVHWAAASAPAVLLPTDPAFEAVPIDINARGTIVGTMVRLDVEHVVAWLGPEHRLREFGEGAPSALNDRDVVAGAIAGTPDSGPWQLGCLWDLRRGTVIRLPPLNPQDDYVELADINDAGIAVGTAFDTSGDGHPVLYRGYAPTDD